MIGEVINVPLTPTSTCGHVVKEILVKYPMYSNLKAEWGLFVPDLKVLYRCFFTLFSNFFHHRIPSFFSFVVRRAISDQRRKRATG